VGSSSRHTTDAITSTGEVECTGKRNAQAERNVQETAFKDTGAAWRSGAVLWSSGCTIKEGPMEGPALALEDRALILRHSSSRDTRCISGVLWSAIRVITCHPPPQTSYCI